MTKPKAQKAPALPPPTAIPEVAQETEETAMKQIRRRSGYGRTVITGSLSPAKRGKTVLG
jgi:hypothetical protein